MCGGAEWHQRQRSDVRWIVDPHSEGLARAEIKRRLLDDRPDSRGTARVKQIAGSVDLTVQVVHRRHIRVQPAATQRQNRGVRQQNSGGMVETRHSRIRPGGGPQTSRGVPDRDSVFDAGELVIDLAAAAHHDPAVRQYRQVRPNAVWRKTSGGREHRSGSADIHDPTRAVRPKDQAFILGEHDRRLIKIQTDRGLSDHADMAISRGIDRVDGRATGGNGNDSSVGGQPGARVIITGTGGHFGDVGPGQRAPARARRKDLGVADAGAAQYRRRRE